MDLKIEKIILYSFNRDLNPRILNFDLNKVNVITGYSQRGKSAVISIIDYCLCSGECNIPIGTIRDRVEIFSLIIVMNGKRYFIARENPLNQKSTDIMYFHQIVDEKNLLLFTTNEWQSYSDDYKHKRENLKGYLSVEAGFENISEHDNYSKNGFDAPVTFRDTSAFQFQTQNIIANPTTLFYNTDSFEHLKRLRILFPLVLGYKSFDILNLEKEIEVLEKEEKDKANKFDESKRFYENWQKEIYEYYSKAITLGLTNADLNIEGTKVDFIKSELLKIISNVQNNKYFIDGSTLRHYEKLNEFENQKLISVRLLNDLRTSLLKLEQFDKSKDVYVNDVANEIENRLKPIDWFINQHGAEKCPFCDSNSTKAIAELLELKSEREKNSKILSDSTSMKFSFEKEKHELRKQIQTEEKKIKAVDANINILLNENSEFQKRLRDIFEYTGKVEQFIDNLSTVSPDGDLFIELEKLKQNIAGKKKNLKTLQDKFNRESSLNKITAIIQEYIRILPIENRSTKRVLLDPEASASIKIEDTQTNNITFLSRIGSGANHMCYHLATILGLHEYFYKLTSEGKRNFIPSFLIIDQPSQVYFPEEFPSTTDKETSKISEDIENTKLIFNACSKFLERTDFKTQIIILEHASISTWENIDNINLVEEWRGKIDVENSNFNALIQKDWLMTE